MVEINWIFRWPVDSTVSPPVFPRTNKSDPLIKACPDCPMTFVRPTDLSRHQLKHKRRFICPHCQARFTFGCNMKRHIRRSCPNKAKRPLVAPDGSGSNYSNDDSDYSGDPELSGDDANGSNLTPVDPYGSMLDSILGTSIKNFRWTDYPPIILTK